jgi:hypothetical protein
MRHSDGTQIVFEIRRAQELCRAYNGVYHPRMCSAAAASILGITQAQLRYRHRELADKSVHCRLQWHWGDIEQILQAAGPTQ